MSKFDKTYTNGEVTVYWKPDICIHSAKCFHNLPEVFDPRERPWVRPENSTTEKIVETVKNCPSGALSFKYNNEINTTVGKSVEEKSSEEKPLEKPLENSHVRIEVSHNGPLRVTGTCVIIDKDGNETMKEGKFALCRCGLSTKKPFCDGAHKTLTHDL